MYIQENSAWKVVTKFIQLLSYYVIGYYMQFTATRGLVLTRAIHVNSRALETMYLSGLFCATAIVLYTQLYVTSKSNTLNSVLNLHCVFP
jgi:hypothetical protein